MNGRENPQLTEPYFQAVKNWTGDRPLTCPWRAFYDPLVRDVIDIYPYFSTGQLAMVLGPDPPTKIIEALGYYHTVLERISAKQFEAERKKCRKP